MMTTSGGIGGGWLGKRERGKKPAPPAGFPFTPAQLGKREAGQSNTALVALMKTIESELDRRGTKHLPDDHDPNRPKLPTAVNPELITTMRR